MSRPMGIGSRDFLAAFVGDQPLTRAQLRANCSAPEQSLKTYISRFRVYGLIEESASPKDGSPRTYSITAAGREKLEWLEKHFGSQPRGGGSTRDRAMSLIRRAPMGLDSSQLAEQLGAKRDEIEDALEPDVKEHRLSTCLVVRGEMQCTLYRISLAGASTLRDVRAPAAPEGIAHARAASKPTELPKAPVVELPRSTKPSTYDQVIVSAPRAAAPAPQRDEVRKVIAEAAAPAEIRGRRATAIIVEDLARTSAEDDNNFVCYLQSDGVLSIVSAGRSIDLPAEHALKLSGYLHHVRSIRMLSEIVSRGQP